MTSGIYCIRNLIDDKRYIGQAVDINMRWLSHTSRLSRNKSPHKHLQNAWNKYGSDNFVFEILEETSDDAQVLKEREQYWNDCYNPNVYNIRVIVESNRGYQHTEEAKLKIGAAQKGKQNRLGKTLSDEAKTKVSLANKGKKRSDETREKIRVARIGSKRSDETKLKMSMAQKGKVISDETRKRMSAAFTGRNLSDEERSKRSTDVIQFDKITNEVIKIWDTVYEAATTLGIQTNNIVCVCKGTRKSAGGYGWKYNVC